MLGPTKFISTMLILVSWKNLERAGHFRPKPATPTIPSGPSVTCKIYRLILRDKVAVDVGI